MYLLNEFEKKYCIPNGKLLSDYFHMICGTSVGSLITIAITLKIPISIIMNTFEKNVSSIFPTKNKGSTITQPFINMYYYIMQLIGKKYDVTPLKQILESFTANKTFKDMNNLICIPSYCVNRSKICVFKNTQIEYETSEESSIDVKLSDMILASSAAPNYFYPYKIKNDYFLDGGLWAYDPSEVGIVESLKYFVGDDKEYDDYALLSIGNLSIDQTNQTNQTNQQKSFFDFSKLLNLFSSKINSNSDLNPNSSEYFAKKIEQCNVGKKIRIEHKEQNEYSLDESSVEFLGLLQKYAIEDSAKYLDGPLNNDIKIFFE